MNTSVYLLVLGLLGLSLGIMGLPVEDSFDLQDSYSSGRYNPQDFYSSWRVPQESAGRIVGGWEAPEASAPHMVGLIIGVSVKSFVCGGFVAKPDVVLTAAHCIDAVLSWWTGELVETFRGQIGSNALSHGYVEIRFSGHLNHPAWDRVNIKNDVGALWLTEALPKNSPARPIALSFRWIGGGERLTVTGWGRLSAWGALPDRLQKLQVYSLTHAECKEEMQRASDELGSAAPGVAENIEICTTHPLGAGQGMCNGDSGSALWLDKKSKTKCVKGNCEKCNKWENCEKEKCEGVKRVVVGVVSWGFPCARGYPDAHARISGFKDFLVSNLRLSADEYEE
ncbi:chymotrypsin-2-like isoform X2 [Cydia pomonella]|uniref:chymotrypsin-2-like isoform X2 n=1 Tax=Cydia pomonella TaxID=82600 RepID=UPI002ADE91A2|nr:chymotrypsin-2-like isoform X2 [Cydia pomonella]